MWDQLQQKVKVLNERVWENRASWPSVNRWLANFTGKSCATDEERLYALFLLSHMMYFGARETRALLKAMYKEAVRYPIVETVRQQNNDTTDETLITAELLKELRLTRFLGIGNPSESGTHLLYHFRQENSLSKKLFINAHEIFTRSGDGSRVIRDKTIKRYVFLDDLCGSGQQAKEYSKELLTDLKNLQPDVHVAYCVLFATSTALEQIRKTLFDEVTCIFELDASFKCFGDQSRYFGKTAGTIDKTVVREMALKYGQELEPVHPLGFRDCQLLLAFHHNTPDNTLPIIWYDEIGTSWQPIFKRYPKFAW